MKKLSNIEKIIIQNKVDGNLTQEEEEYFKNLIETSSEALKEYRNLLSVHLSLQNDSKIISPIDLSGKILSRIEKNKKTLGHSKKITFNTNIKKQVFALAAVFIFGIISGITVTYLVTANSPNTDTSEVSGTLIKKTKDTFFYKEYGTEIIAKKYDAGKVQLITITINSIDTIYCSIENKNKLITDNDIDLIYSSGIIKNVSTETFDLKYLSKGEVVFQIKSREDFHAQKIHFYKGGKMIYELK